MSFLDKLNDIKDFIALQGRNGISSIQIFDKYALSTAARSIVTNHLHQCGFQFTIDGADASIDDILSKDAAEYCIVAPPRLRLAALGIASKSQLPQESAYAVLELIGRSGEEGIYVSDIGFILEARNVHSLLDALLEKQLITKYIVGRLIPSKKGNSIRRENLLRLRRFDAWIPQGLHDNLSEHEHPAFSTILRVMQDYDLTSVPATSIASLVGISMDAMELHLRTVLHAGLSSTTLVYHPHISTNEPMITMQKPDEPINTNNFMINVPLIAQALHMIQNAGSQGVSTTELRRVLGLSQKALLAVILPVLTRDLKLPTKDVQIGRQRTICVYASTSARDGVDEAVTITTFAPRLVSTVSNAAPSRVLQENASNIDEGGHNQDHALQTQYRKERCDLLFQRLQECGGFYDSSSLCQDWKELARSLGLVIENDESGTRPMKRVHVFLSQMEREKRIVRCTLVRGGRSAQAAVVADPSIVNDEDFNERLDSYVQHVRDKHNIHYTDHLGKQQQNEVEETEVIEVVPPAEKKRKANIEELVEIAKKQPKTKRTVAIPHPVPVTVAEIFNYMLTRRGTMSMLRVLFMTQPAGLCFAAQSVHACIVRNFPTSDFSLTQLLRHITMANMVSCFRMPDMLMRHTAVLLDRRSRFKKSAGISEFDEVLGISMRSIHQTLGVLFDLLITNWSAAADNLQTCFLPQLQQMVQVLVDLRILNESSTGYTLSGSVPLAESAPTNSISADAYWNNVLLPALRSGVHIHTLTSGYFDKDAFNDVVFTKDDVVVKRRISDWRVADFGDDYQDVFHGEDDRLLQLIEEAALKPRAPRRARKSLPSSRSEAIFFAKQQQPTSLGSELIKTVDGVKLVKFPKIFWTHYDDMLCETETKHIKRFVRVANRKYQQTFDLSTLSNSLKFFKHILADEVVVPAPKKSLLSVVNQHMLDKDSHDSYLLSPEGIFAEAAITRALQIYCASPCFLRYVSGDYSETPLPRDHVAIVSLRMYPLVLVQRIHRELTAERMIRKLKLRGNPDGFELNAYFVESLLVSETMAYYETLLKLTKNGTRPLRVGSIADICYRPQDITTSESLTSAELMTLSYSTILGGVHGTITVEDSGAYSVGQEYLSKKRPQTCGNTNISYIRDPPAMYVSFKPQKDVTTSTVKQAGHNAIQKGSKALNRLEVSFAAALIPFPNPPASTAVNSSVAPTPSDTHLCDAIVALVSATDQYGVRLHDLKVQVASQNIMISDTKLRDTLRDLQCNKLLYVLPVFDGHMESNDLILSPQHAQFYMIRDARDGYCCWCHFDGTLNYALYYALVARIIRHLQLEPKSNIYRIHHSIMFLPLAQCRTLLRQMLEMNLIDEEISAGEEIIPGDVFEFSDVMDIVNAPAVNPNKATLFKDVYYSLKLAVPPLC